MNTTIKPLSRQLAVAAALLLFLSPLANASRNILFIAIDDMRVEPQALTPNIDALAATSTRYNNAYTSVPSCVGSRMTVLTGLKPSTHGVGLTVFDLSGYHAMMNDPGVTTLPEEMSDHGYLSATMGKISHFPAPAKWDVAQPYVDTLTLYNPFAPGPDGTYLWASVLPPEETHPDQEVADWAEDFINNHSGPQPFFLAIGFYQPHIPWRVPQWAYDLYPNPTPGAPIPNDMADEPAAAINLATELIYGNTPQYDIVENAGKRVDYTRAYLASISHTDAMVGQVLDALAQSPHAATTDIILWSDHGYHLGEKRHWRKMTFWEPAVKVPFYIKSPAIPAGDVTDEVSLLDLAPTVLDLAGAPVEPQFEGVSLVSGRSPVEIFYGDGKATVSAGTKSIDYDVNNVALDDIAEYYLPNDPLEQVNLTPPPGC